MNRRAINGRQANCVSLVTDSQLSSGTVRRISASQERCRQSLLPQKKSFTLSHFCFSCQDPLTELDDAAAWLTDPSRDGHVFNKASVASVTAEAALAHHPSMHWVRSCHSQTRTCVCVSWRCANKLTCDCGLKRQSRCSFRNTYVIISLY